MKRHDNHLLIFKGQACEREARQACVATAPVRPGHGGSRAWAQGQHSRPLTENLPSSPGPSATLLHKQHFLPHLPRPGTGN